MPLANEPPLIDQLLLRNGEAANHYAGILARSFHEFWDRDPAVILAELNGDVAKYSMLFSLNEAQGTSVNAALDAFDSQRFQNRAVIDMPEGWSFNGTAFEYTEPQ